MKAIILGAGQGIIRQNEQESIPKCLLSTPFGRRVLDWTLNSLEQAGIRDVIFVGGFHIEKVMPDYPNLKYYINPNWESGNMVESLFRAKPEMDTACIVSYSDVVYRPNVVEKLMGSDAEVALVADRKWRERYAGRTDDLLTESDKVVVDGNKVIKIGKRIDLNENVWGEFIGLVMFSRIGVEALKRCYFDKREKDNGRSFHEASDMLNAGLPDILQELIDTGINVEVIDTYGDWAELDAPQDLAQFVFGTKAETLERLRPIVKKSNICDQVRFTVKEWRASRPELLKKISDSFKLRPIIVRSSALDEDSWGESGAGRYLSVLDVDSHSEEAVASSIDKVVESYEAAHSTKGRLAHQVLIQPSVRDVTMSGVLFTRAPEMGAPYYIINYDDKSSLTNTVTSGSTENLNSIYVLKKYFPDITDPKIRVLLDAAHELEQIVGYDSLDIEFALTGEDLPYILQARPMVAHKNSPRVDDQDILREVSDIKEYVTERMLPSSEYFGKTTIFGVMPDWNPAEIIGISPRPLALSLYQYLITNMAWSKARAMIGYKDLGAEPLMVALAGRPYIDARVSFNSFLPDGLPDDLCSLLVDYYIQKLKLRPELHDKIEFEIAFTCLDFNTKKNLGELLNRGFDQKHLNIFYESLGNMTLNILTQKSISFSRLKSQIESLGQRRERLLNQKIDKGSLPRVISSLLRDCIRFGTIPFSIYARFAFMGTSILNSLVTNGIIQRDEYDRFLNSVPTVAGRFIRDIDRVYHGELSRKIFLESYGHLRPGTYDILSPKYDEMPDLYLSLDGGTDGKSSHRPSNHLPDGPREFQFSSRQLDEIDRRLKENKMPLEAGDLVNFIRESIQGRELSKFEFTKNLSSALLMLSRLGEEMGFSKDDISFVPISAFLRLASENLGCSFKKEMDDIVCQGKKRHMMAQAVCLPDMIQSPEDIENFKVLANKPNFITRKRISAETFLLNEVEPTGASFSITGKIVLIENADPGFDWIFGRDIKGLITKYGGALSHMAIRSAEFGLPSAIGCGPSIFGALQGAKRIELNCSSKQIKIIE